MKAQPGIDRLSNPQNVQVVVTGNGDKTRWLRRSELHGFPASRLSFTNNTSVSNTRMTGDNSFEQFNNATFTGETLNFQFLGLLLITNSTDIRYKVSKTLDVFAGFRYSDRQIRSTEDGASPGSPFAGISAEHSNQLRAGVAGSKLDAIQGPASASGDRGVSSNDHPFAPISQKNYDIHTLAYSIPEEEITPWAALTSKAITIIRF